MNDPREPMSSSPSPTQWLAEALAPDFTLAPWQRRIVESLYQDTTEPRPVPRIVPTRRQRSAPVRYTLKLTWWLTPHDMGYPWRERLSTAPIPPAIHALAFSLIQESSKWCSIVNIETSLASDSSPT